MHPIHTTDGIILAEQDTGESSRLYHILTPDWGLIAARAQGARELKSKLRGHLVPFACLRVSLVRGREMWRLTGAERREEWPAARAAGPKRALALRVSGLLRRFSPEAAADAALFAIFLDGSRELENLADEPAALERHEIVWVWRLLGALGYISEVGRGSESGVNSEILVREINQALAHSHL